MKLTGKRLADLFLSHKLEDGDRMTPVIASLADGIGLWWNVFLGKAGSRQATMDRGFDTAPRSAGLEEASSVNKGNLVRDNSRFAAWVRKISFP